MKVLVQEIECDDWKAIYINGKLAIDGHNVSITDLCEQLQNLITHNGNKYEQSDYIFSIQGEKYYLNSEYAEEHGFPDYYEDIPDEMFE